MKTLLLFMTGLLLIITTVSATHLHPKPKRHHLDITKHYHYAQQPIVFVERGIEFSVFPDGSFNFEVLRYTNYNASNSRRTAINASYATRGLRVQYTSDRFRKPMIVKDRFGYITRIGNTPIYYDRMGDVTQIGSVDIDYRRGNKMVSKVGGLRVNYNHWGQIVHTSGYVNHLNRDLNHQVSVAKEASYNNYDEDDEDDHYNDDSFYHRKHSEEEE